LKWQRLIPPLAIAFALALAMPAFGAKEPETLSGMEIELDAGPFSRLLRYFDLRKFQRTHRALMEEIPTDLLESYLERDPSAFDDLPPRIKSKLTEGMTRINDKMIMDSQGPVPKQAPQKMPNSLDASLDTMIREKLNWKQEGALVLPDGFMKRRDWDEVLRRWRALDISEKRWVVRLDHLPRLEAAEILIKKANIDLIDLEIRQDAPEAARQLLEKLSWGYDPMGISEFRHRHPTDSPKDTLRDLRALASLAHIQDKDISGESIHFHISRKDGKAVELVARGLNTIKVMRLLDRVKVELLLSKNRVNAYRKINEKGLVMLVAHNRLELRELLDDPEIEFKTALRYMADEDALYKDVEEALAKLDLPRLRTLLLYHGEVLALDLVKLGENGKVRNLAKIAAMAKPLLEDPDVRIRWGAFHLVLATEPHVWRISHLIDEWLKTSAKFSASETLGNIKEHLDVMGSSSRLNHRRAELMTLLLTRFQADDRSIEDREYAFKLFTRQFEWRPLLPEIGIAAERAWKSAPPELKLKLMTALTGLHPAPPSVVQFVLSKAGESPEYAPMVEDARLAWGVSAEACLRAQLKSYLKGAGAP